MKSNTAALVPATDPETLLLHTDDVTLIERAMRTLPDRFRELLVLRELEGLSYRELADVMRHSDGHRHVEPVARPPGVPRRAGHELKRCGVPRATSIREQEPDAVLV